VWSETQPEVPLRIPKLADQILRILVERVVRGVVTPGSPLPSEAQISAEFGVSKSVAREVVAGLVSRRLATVSQGRRPEVRPPDQWDVFDPLIHELQDEDGLDALAADMYAVRSMLEPEIAAEAARSISSEGLAELAAVHDRMRALAGTPERWEADVEFHEVLARATGNRIIEHIMESLRQLMRVSVQRRAESLSGAAPTEREYHDEILRAVEAHDPEAARVAMRAHMQLAAPQPKQ
jgi:DNA-binding FadR family transcriptional regulator